MKERKQGNRAMPQLFLI